MKWLKKSTNILLIALLIIVLCSCGSSKSKPAQKESKEENTKQASKKEAKAPKQKEFKVGQTWTVDEQWSVTVTNVTETNDRNEYSEKKPAAVYIVDYTYSNLGYEDSSGLMNGLIVSFDNQIVDAEGTVGYEYPGDQSAYPQEVPIGASCKTQAVIGVEHAGTFSVSLSMYDSFSKLQTAKFIMVPEAKAAETEENSNQIDTSSTLKNGQTWTVDGQWELTIDGASEVDDRNEFSDINPGAVYVIDYHYNNLGYQDSSGMMDGLFFDLENSIVDVNGIMGYSYPGDITNYPQETPVGASCNAQVCIGVDNPGSFIINVVQQFTEL